MALTYFLPCASFLYRSRLTLYACKCFKCTMFYKNSVLQQKGLLNPMYWLLNKCFQNANDGIKWWQNKKQLPSIILLHRTSWCFVTRYIVSIFHIHWRLIKRFWLSIDDFPDLTDWWSGKGRWWRWGWGWWRGRHIAIWWWSWWWSVVHWWWKLVVFHHSGLEKNYYRSSQMHLHVTFPLFPENRKFNP